MPDGRGRDFTPVYAGWTLKRLPPESAEVFEAHVDFAFCLVRRFRCHLPHVDGFFHCKAMDAVSAAEVEAEKLRRNHG